MPCRQAWGKETAILACMSDKAVLYVEDDENAVFLLRQAFETAGRKEPFYVCADGDQAIDFLARNAQSNVPERTVMPSLVILDLHLPKKTGLDVLKWIRRHPAFSTVPVIMFSSSNHMADIHRSYSLGANAFLVKPSSTEKMMALARTLCEFWLEQNQPPPDFRQFENTENGSPGGLRLSPNKNREP
jgi:CheY-like chemotaxis protein